METPETSPGFLLWRVTLGWQREVTLALKPLGLTHVQFVLLATCWWENQHGRQPTQAALAESAVVDVKMASEVIRVLERKGLMSREIAPHDSRARQLVVTSEGGHLAPEAIKVVEAVDAKTFGVLSAGSRELLVKVLHTLYSGGDADS